MLRDRQAVLAILVAVGVAVGAATPGQLNAAPQVEIKGKSALFLTRVKARDGGVEVTGQLVDKLTNEGLAGQTISVTIAGVAESAMTQPDGTFHAVVSPADPGPQKVELGYRGTRVIDRADVLSVTTDPSKQQIELAITKLGDEPQGARLRLAALGEDGPVLDLPIELEIAAQNTDAFHAIEAGRSGAALSLRRKAAGGAGMFRLRAIYRGDGHDQAATKEVLIELAASTVTTMTLSSTKLAYEDDLVARGAVLDDDAAPVPEATVTLTSGDRRLAQGATDRTGAFRFSVEASVLGQGELGIQVQADPGKSYMKPSRSEPVVVRVSAPAPVPVSYTVAAFLATGLAAAAFFVARKRPWRRFLAPPAPVEGTPSGDEVPADMTDGGLVIAKPGIVSTLRRASDDGFAGLVRDTVRGRPIGDAAIRITLGETVHELRSAADGTFAVERLGTGDWQAEVSSLGHVTERFGVTIPHHGELRGVRVDLVPVRERVFQLYRLAAEPVLPEPRLWGIWSPRQIVDHVRAKRPSPALLELTDYVEELYFSPRIAVEAALSGASERVDRAIDERASRR